MGTVMFTIGAIEQYLLWATAAPRLAAAVLVLLAGTQALLSRDNRRREQAHALLRLLRPPQARATSNRLRGQRDQRNPMPPWH
jgi:hypothetical protein